MKRISIALATFNGEAYIERQLQSLVEQELRPNELVIADDGSTDGTLGIISSFSRRSPFEVRILRGVTGRNLRPPKNFERALRACTGDMVFCCDQDDEWDRDKIAKAYELLHARSELACLLTNARFCDAGLNPTGLDKLGEIRRSGLPDSAFVMGCCAVFRKDLLKIALPIPSDITHDGWLVGLSDSLGLTSRSTEVLQSYRIHDSNVSKAFAVNSSPANLSATARAARRLIDLARKSVSNSALLQELLFVTEAESRISSSRDQIATSFPTANVGSALHSLGHLMEGLALRRQIRLSNFGARPNLVWHAYRRGYYRGSAKALLALKDAVSVLTPSERFTLWPPQ